jgi:hypothetical protein
MASESKHPSVTLSLPEGSTPLPASVVPRLLRTQDAAKLIAYVNRKRGWHIPPVDPDAYKKRGKFFSVSFAAAEFWGRPLDEPEKVTISQPLVGDEKTIAKVLGIPPQREGMTLKQIATHDAKWRNAELKKGFDAIVLMAPVTFAEWKKSGKIPRSLELNVLRVSESQGVQT